jgi:hypothetical protein
MYLTVDTSFIFTKKSNIAKCVFYISNAEIAVLPRIRCHFSNKMILKLKLSQIVFYKKCGPTLIFFNETKIRKTFLDFESPNFIILYATVPSQH